MKKIFLIIKREYLSRVKKKSFLVVTFLVPILLLAMWGGGIALSIQDNVTMSTVKVIDESGLIFDKLEETSSLRFEAAENPADKEKSNLKNQENQYLLLPSGYSRPDR